jgi:hypothetical protein
LPREPYAPNEARKRISRILQHGAVTVWDHCKDELAKDDMTIADAVNVLRCGRIREPAEQVKDAWRYRVHTDHMGVVVQFEGETGVAIVTAWRKAR